MLLAVHIADGILPWPWLLGGFLAAGILAWFGCLARRRPRGVLDFLQWLTHPRLDEEEIPRIAVLSSAFFVASSIHMPFWPTSVHLLLNGLVGILLGWRSAIAIPLGLLLQWALLGHGGITALGVNSCIMVVPALTAYFLFTGLRRWLWLRSRWFQFSLTAVCMTCWVLLAVFCVAVLAGQSDFESTPLLMRHAAETTLHPWSLTAALAFGLLAATFAARRAATSEFAAGLFVGGFAVLMTASLGCGVLLLSRSGEWRIMAFTLLIAHLPVALLEGIVTGFTVQFLAKVRPEMLGIGRTDPLSAAKSLPN